MKSSLLRRQNGFNLIEVTIALAVVSIGIIGVLSLLPHGLDAARNSADRTIAASVAQDLITDLRNLPFNNLINLTPSEFPYYYDQSGLYLTNQSKNYASVATNACFAVTVQCNNWTGPGGNGDLQAVSVTVDWPSKPPEATTPPLHRETYVTAIAKCTP